MVKHNPEEKDKTLQAVARDNLDADVKKLMLDKVPRLTHYPNKELLNEFLMELSRTVDCKALDDRDEVM